MFKESYEIRHDHGRVDVRLEGELRPEAVAAVIRKVRAVAFELEYCLFYDCTGADVSRISIGDAYAATHGRDVLVRVPEHRCVRAAILVEPDRDAAFWSFYETTAFNAGLLVKVFQERSVAEAWLLQASVAS